MDMVIRKKQMKLFSAAVVTSVILMSGMVTYAAEDKTDQTVVVEPTNTEVTDIPAQTAPVDMTTQTDTVTVEPTQASEPATPIEMPTEAGAAVYTQVMLDAYIKMDPTSANALGYMSTQTWKDSFTSSFEQLYTEIEESFPMSDEALNELINASLNMLSRTRYMAGATRQLEDGTYEVMVAYEQMQVFSMFWDRYVEALVTLEQGEPRDEEKALSEWIIIAADILNQCCEEAVYAEPMTTTILIQYVDGQYQISEEQINEFSRLLYDTIGKQTSTLQDA